ncbi:MAG: phosphoglucomutase/phosphomannomutase family protein [Geitlerinemataceae cyanobacterium]
MTQPSVFPTSPNPIKFGTDGWRGVIAADFTFDRVARVAIASARILARVYGDTTENSNLIVVGYDRRFMAEHFARTAAEVLQQAGFDVLFSESYASTPAFSWAAHHRKALGAIVMTASHNPGVYLGLKVKGGFGGSVSPEITQQIEAQLENPAAATTEKVGTLETFDPWTEFCADLRSKVDIDTIRNALSSGQLTVFADVMHGAAAGGLEKILEMPVTELNSDRDPLFGGGAPEPLPRHLTGLCNSLKTHGEGGGGLAVGLAFDGDGDRIAAADGEGNFLSSQVLIPILLEHLTQRRGFTGEIIKTISGSDLIPRIVQLYNLPLYETPIGYKYIADRMVAENSLLGGEESGGIGYSTHIPERDALLSALYVMEAVVQSGKDLGELYRNLQEKVNFTSEYDRIDLPLASMEVRSRLVEQLDTKPPTEIAGQTVTDCLAIDGYKFRLADDSWILIRFSGTEPVLRLYSEAANMQRVRENLAWAKDWANSI